MKKIFTVIVIACTACCFQTVVAQQKVGEIPTAGGVRNMLDAPDSLSKKAEVMIHQVDSLCNALLKKAKRKGIKEFTDEGPYEKKYDTPTFSVSRREHSYSNRPLINNDIYISNVGLCIIHPADSGKHNCSAYIRDNHTGIDYHGALGIQNDVPYFEADKNATVEFFFNTLQTMRSTLIARLTNL